ncbi:unnamed protein product [marine sediment metagenome]|uniref:DUF5615 domain-containing protein n=1 Tax=marine sediment metagenome TaxID=412755 RepID=X0T6T1_9ZZZZ
MKILADIHISPITVRFLQDLGHDAIRVNEILPSNSSDKTIVETAKKERRIEYVNKRLEKVLPKIEYDIKKGSIIVVEDSRIRLRSLPV